MCTDESSQQLLEQLIQRACAYPPCTPERQKLVTRIISIIRKSPCLWRGAGTAPDIYQQALQDTWLWFCERLCEYDSSKSKVLTWFNNQLKNRIRELEQKIAEERAREIPSLTNQDGEETDPVERIPAPLVDSYTLLELELVEEEVLAWVSRCGASLRRKRVDKKTKLNCAVLIPLRLPQKDEESGQYIDPLTWEEIAEQLTVPPEAIAAMRRCYREKCRPCLLEFLRSRGYDP